MHFPQRVKKRIMTLQAGRRTSICCASSRVGAMMTAKGPSAATSSVITGCFWMYTSIGSTKAAVLPLPAAGHLVLCFGCSKEHVGLQNSRTSQNTMPKCTIQSTVYSMDA